MQWFYKLFRWPSPSFFHIFINLDIISNCLRRQNFNYQNNYCHISPKQSNVFIQSPSSTLKPPPCFTITSLAKGWAVNHFRSKYTPAPRKCSGLWSKLYIAATVELQLHAHHMIPSDPKNFFLIDLHSKRDVCKSVDMDCFFFRVTTPAK